MQNIMIIKEVLYYGLNIAVNFMSVRRGVGLLLVKMIYLYKHIKILAVFCSLLEHSKTQSNNISLGMSEDIPGCISFLVI